MNILYDHQVFSYQSYGGISRYFCEILKQFQKKKSPDFNLAVLFSNNHHLKNLSGIQYRSFLKSLDFRGKSLLMMYLNKLYSRRIIDQQKFDVFHPTYYEPYFLEHLRGKPFVITIHDMIHELFPEYFNPKDRIPEKKRLLAEKASHIIAVSENTKKDILRLLNIKENKITVIHHGFSFAQLAGACPPQIKIPSRYIFFVGSRHAYKNFEFFITAIAPLLQEDRTLHVICVGNHWSLSEIQLFESLNIKEQLLDLNLPDKNIWWLYQNALAFVFPSLYEGFGIPVLEAMGCGCPTILSQCSSLPEVGGTAAVYFDPKSEISLKNAVQSVIYNETTRKELKAAGLERVKEFTWKKTSQRTQSLYQSILS